MLDRNHNSIGSHGDDLMSYIYGEMDEHARNAFETHLEQCDDCAVELGAVSDARLGVVEWRRNDFDHLVTPQIFIPQEKAATTVAAPERTGLFAGLAELIASASVFTKASVGLAATALLVGVIYFSSAPRNTRIDVADSPKLGTQVPPQASPKNSESATPQQNEIAKDTDVKPVDKPVQITRHYSAPSKSAALSQHVAVNKEKQKNEKRLGPEMAKVPRLNSFDDDEDQTLRLSDLFSQVGPTKR